MHALHNYNYQPQDPYTKPFSAPHEAGLALFHSGCSQLLDHALAARSDRERLLSFHEKSPSNRDMLVFEL